MKALHLLIIFTWCFLAVFAQTRKDQTGKIKQFLAKSGYRRVLLGKLDTCCITTRQLINNAGIGLRLAGGDIAGVKIVRADLTIICRGGDYCFYSMSGNKIYPNLDFEHLPKGTRIYIEGILLQVDNDSEYAQPIIYNVF